MSLLDHRLSPQNIVFLDQGQDVECQLSDVIEKVISERGQGGGAQVSEGVVAK